jgi:hypothetical protein
MDNPYQTSAYGNTYPTATGQVSPGAIQALAATRPWVRLCSVMGFIGAGLMILAGLGLIAGGALTSSSSRAVGAQSFVGVMYIVMSLLYLVPSLKLWKYGTAILHLMSTNSAADLEQALEQQRGFWKFVGILVMISIGFMIVAMVIGGVAGAMSASSRY